MAVASISTIGYFLPIFAFLLVFIVVYALLVKSAILGNSPTMMIFISFIVSSFFIVEAQLVEFVEWSGAWFGMAVVTVFFLITLVALVPGVDIGKFFGGEKSWLGMIVFGLGTVFFVVSSAYVFNWAINWGMIRSWFDTEWFGMVLLLVIAGIVSVTITKKV